MFRKTLENWLVPAMIFFIIGLPTASSSFVALVLNCTTVSFGASEISNLPASS